MEDNRVWSAPRACYVHVPFCTHRCGYCDFTLIARRPDLVGDYLAALELELRAALPSGGCEQPELDTLFFGGGTPTFLTAPQLERLGELLRDCFRLAPGYEWSIEANPTGLTDDKLEVLRDLGVNRVSLGIQSFDADLLKLLERDHDGVIAIDAVTRLQSRFENVSIDLIFGIPGQTLEHWQQTLQQAVSLGVQHISTYGLTFEAGTAFWSRKAKGLIRPIPNELERSMYEWVMEFLPSSGYPQYEISNFARTGFEARHNQTYWRSEPFYGFGPGAASYLDGVRQTNHRSVTTWIRKTLAGEPAVGDREKLDPEATAREAVMLGLRQCRGINLREFANRFGFEMPPLAGDEFETLLADGLIEVIEGACRLTPSGRCVADGVIMEFLA